MLLPKVIGIHPVDAPEPCHLVECEFASPVKMFDWGKVTQRVDGEPEANWQAVLDEQEVGQDGNRWVFFFHYLDAAKPLLVYGHEVPLPSPSYGA